MDEITKKCEQFVFKPIGYVTSCYKEKFATPRQSGLSPVSRGSIHLLPHIQPQESLEGLEKFSHLWIIFVFHQNSNKECATKVHPPRLGGQKVGVFASRSPHRFNPIGLSLVKLEKIENGILFISGLDLVDGTPVLDLKPYLPDTEALSTATHGWLDKIKENLNDVCLLPSAINDLQQIAVHELAELSREDRLIHVQKLIVDTLKHDPRPTIYKGNEDNPNPYRNEYGFYLYNLNIKFRIDKGRVEVFKIEEAI